MINKKKLRVRGKEDDRWTKKGDNDDERLKKEKKKEASVIIPREKIVEKQNINEVREQTEKDE